MASQPESASIDDGLVLDNVWVTAPVRCAPPQPTSQHPAERDTCAEAGSTRSSLSSPMQRCSWPSASSVTRHCGQHLPSERASTCPVPDPAFVPTVVRWP